MWLLILMIIEFAPMPAIIFVGVGANCFHLHILACKSPQEVMNSQITPLAPLNCFYFEVILIILVIYRKHSNVELRIVFYSSVYGHFFKKESCFLFCVCCNNLYWVQGGKEKKGWTLVVTADSQGCQCCRLTAPEFLWRCVCLKKHWKHSAAVKNRFKGAFQQCWLRLDTS